LKKHIIVFILSILPAFIGFGAGFGYWYLKEKKKGIIAIVVHLLMYVFSIYAFTVPSVRFPDQIDIIVAVSPYVGIGYLGAWIYEIINCQLIAKRKR